MSAVRQSLIALLIGGLPLTYGSAVAERMRSGAELLSAAERSFSAIPFGTTNPPAGLVLVDEAACQSWGECSYIDSSQVEHCFCDGEGALAVKSINVTRLGDVHIAALGIGNARGQNEVVEQVRHFLPEADIGCSELPEALDGTSICDATLGEGWIRLFFDGARRLTEVRIDAYHFV